LAFPQDRFFGPGLFRNAPLVGFRMTNKFQGLIKPWAAKQSDKPALATAIRRLVEIVLKAKK
jgi:hypothetical protein